MIGYENQSPNLEKVTDRSFKSYQPKATTAIDQLLREAVAVGAPHRQQRAQNVANGSDLFATSSKPHTHKHAQFVQNMYSPGLDMFYDLNLRDNSQPLENLITAPAPPKRPTPRRAAPKRTPNGISLEDPDLKAAFERGRNKWLHASAQPRGLLGLN